MSEAALKAAAAKARMRDVGGAPLPAYERVRELEIPFTSSRKMAATVHKLPGGGRFEALHLGEDVGHVGIVKGAPDKLLCRLGGGVLLQLSGEALGISSEALSEAEREAMEAENHFFACDALRSLLIALVPVDGRLLRRLQGAEGADERVELMLGSAVFLGIFGIYDPPRTSVPPSVAECHKAGIRVVMITGDQQATAAAIGRQVSILFPDDEPSERVRTCSALPVKAVEAAGAAAPPVKLHQKLRHTLDEDDATILSMVAQTRCWARAQPTDKVSIIDSLFQMGHIASMTGDGVNDAPALKRAAIGVAMGIQGTAVAQQASDIILADDNFSTIVAAIREGRKIYANVQKYVLFNLSIKAGECTCLLAAIVLDMPLPISGLQLLLNLITTHIIPTFSLAFEESEEYTMRIPPRNTKRDWILYRTQWVFRWLPFVASMALCVLSCTRLSTWVNAGYTATWQLVGTSRVGYVDSDIAACEFAGHYRSDMLDFIEDESPFHCKCFRRQSPWADPVTIEQWGRSGEEQILEEVFDPWTGSTGTVYDRQNTPFKDGRDAMVEPCEDKRGLKRWCWRYHGVSMKDRPILDRSRHCAAFGTRRGQTMGYVTIHLGEILALLAYRRDDFSLPWLFSNRVYVGMLLFNLSMLLAFLYAPPIAGLSGLLPLPPARLAVSMCFAVLLFFLIELSKVVYRSILSRDIARKERAAGRAARGEALPWDDC
jgi:magnesium-transporting ATPase (P-type)